MANKDKDKLSAAEVTVSGNVQGVFYRVWTRNTAKQMHLKGWVKNTEDGKVKAYFEGKKEDINKMIKLCKEGSKFSEVKEVEVDWVEPKNTASFEIKY